MTGLNRGASGLAALLCAALAAAHPALVGSTPKDGDVLATPPGELRLRFSEPIEPAFTHVELVNAAGIELKGRLLEVTQNDPSSVAMALPALTAGTYRARWSAAGRDGHRVKGEFSFAVK